MLIKKSKVVAMKAAMEDKDREIQRLNGELTKAYSDWVSGEEAFQDLQSQLDCARGALESAKKITGDTSDGYHTFNELYHHRAVLFMVICKTFPELAWKSVKHHDGTMYDGMFIVGLNLPEGQVTYHYDMADYWMMFNVTELETAPEWDGHTPDVAIARLQHFGSRVARSFAASAAQEEVALPKPPKKARKAPVPKPEEGADGQ